MLLHSVYVLPIKLISSFVPKSFLPSSNAENISGRYFSKAAIMVLIFQMKIPEFQ